MPFSEPTAADPVAVVNADCLDYLKTVPDGAFDVVVTSPPYNQLGSRMPSEGTGLYKGMRLLDRVNGVGYADDMDEGEYQGWLARVVGECLRVCKGLVWVNHKVRYRDGAAVHPLHFLKFPLYCEVVWARQGATALNCRRFAPSYELVHGFGRPHYWDDASNRLLSVWHIPQTKGRDDHPCPYPVAIPQRCVRASCPPGGLVLDPFAGSGTTAVAAVKEGCRAVMVERDPKYIGVIRKRVAAERDGGYLVPARTPRPADDTLF